MFLPQLEIKYDIKNKHAAQSSALVIINVVVLRVCKYSSVYCDLVLRS